MTNEWMDAELDCGIRNYAHFKDNSRLTSPEEWIVSNKCLLEMYIDLFKTRFDACLEAAVLLTQFIVGEVRILK
jgi:hypothetical protein